MAASHRTIIESRQFQRELEEIATDHVDADSLVDGAKWLLARDPYAGVQLEPKSRVWFLAIDPPEAKSVGLYYTFDDDTVHFMSITQQP